MTTLPVTSPHAPALLAALRYQGQSNDCGPFTAATVINALRDLNLDPRELADQMNHPVRRGRQFILRRIPNWATFPWGIVDVLHEHGLAAYWRLNTSTDYLLDCLQRGDIVMPIIGSWRPIWAHVMTLIAWHPEIGWGFANTQLEHKNIDWRSHEEFIGQWRAMGRISITTRPDHSPQQE
jgi:hypothetical protein